MRLVVWFWGRRGGGAQFASRLAEGLAECGADVLLHLSSSNLEPLHADVHVVRAPVHHPLGALRAIARPGQTIGSEIRRFNADAVVHPMVNPLTPFAWPSVRLVGRRPILTVIHDPSPHSGDEHLLMDLAARLAIRRSDVLLAPSAFVATALTRATGRTVTTIPFGSLIPGVRLNQKDLADSHVTEGAPLLFAGRMLPYKGLDLLADAWSTFTERSTVRLRIVGEDTGDRSVSDALAKLEAFGADVERGWLSDQTLRAEIGSARALILPYREASQSGLIPIAHSLGVPVIATDVGALREQTGQGGWISTPDAAGLLAALERLVREPESESTIRSLLRRSDHASQDWVDAGLRIVDLVSELKRAPADRSK